jgi:ribosomal protein S18 acetylase RimI-like enzyme
VQPGDRGAIRILVRRARIADLDRLAAVEVQAFAMDAYDRPELLRLVEDEDSIVHVAEADGAVAGFAVTELLPLSEFARRYELPIEKLPHGGKGAGMQIAYFKSIAVTPRYRRRGVGRTLHEVRISLLARLGIDSIFLVQMPHPELPAFHIAMGFSPLGVQASRRYRSGARGSVWHRSVAA